MPCPPALPVCSVDVFFLPVVLCVALAVYFENVLEFIACAGVREDKLVCTNV